MLIGSFEEIIGWCMKRLANEFDMNGIDLMDYILGLEV
jgi:hypothetical protein